MDPPPTPLSDRTYLSNCFRSISRSRPQKSKISISTYSKYWGIQDKIEITNRQLGEMKGTEEMNRREIAVVDDDDVDVVDDVDTG